MLSSGISCREIAAFSFVAHPMDAMASSTHVIPSTPQTIERLVAEKAVVVFSDSTCCICHVVKRLLRSMGVNPSVVEIDEEIDGLKMEKALERMVGETPAIPAVFVGGELVGGLDKLIAAHINGTLVPMLKDARALWL